MRHDNITRGRALYLAMYELHVPADRATAFLCNAQEQGRWDNSYGYITWDGTSYSAYVYV